MVVYLCRPDPDPAAVPDTHHVGRLLDTVEDDVLQFRTLVIVVLMVVHSITRFQFDSVLKILNCSICKV